MNITEFMSFDLEWFTTLPGLLITGGVVVLLIALIIFIVSNKKTEKKNDNEVVPNDDTATVANVGAPIASNTMPTNEQAVTNTMPIDNNMAVNNSVPPIDFSVPISNGYNATPINNMENVNVPAGNTSLNDNVFRATSFNNIIVPTVDETQKVESNFNTLTPVSNNVVDFSATVTPSTPIDATVQPAPQEPAIVPTQEVNTTPIVNEPIVPSADMVPPVVSSEVSANLTVSPVEEKPMIYGGVNPINTIANSTPASRPVIYGGANPLENTTTLPRITNSEAYSASLNSVSNVIPTPVVEQTVSAGIPTYNHTAAPVEPVIPTQVANQYQTPIDTVSTPNNATEMFATNNFSNDNLNMANGASNEIETLDF